MFAVPGYNKLMNKVYKKKEHSREVNTPVCFQTAGKITFARLSLMTGAVIVKWKSIKHGPPLWPRSIGRAQVR